MARILPGLLRQLAYYYPPGTPDKYGVATPGDPILVSCQHEQRNETVTTADGQILTTTGTTFLGVEVRAGGWLMMTTTGRPPEQVDNKNRIKAVEKYQDVGANEKLWKAYT